MSLRHQLRRLLREEEGQSTTEYILILAVVVMIAMKFRKEFGDRVTGMVTKVGSGIETEIGNSMGQ